MGHHIDRFANAPLAYLVADVAEWLRGECLPTSSCSLVDPLIHPFAPLFGREREEGLLVLPQTRDLLIKRTRTVQVEGAVPDDAGGWILR